MISNNSDLHRPESFNTILFPQEQQLNCVDWSQELLFEQIQTQRSAKIQMQFEQNNQELKGEVFDPFFGECKAEACFEEPREIQIQLQEEEPEQKKSGEEEPAFLVPCQEQT